MTYLKLANLNSRLNNIATSNNVSFELTLVYKLPVLFILALSFSRR